MSGDDSLSASELRKRYVAKASDGGLADDELTAAQLRARHGIASNKFAHQQGAGGGGGGGGSSTLAVVAGVLAVVVYAGLAYMLFVGR